MNKLIQRIKAYFAEEEPEPLTCSKCGSDELYIACPDYCYDCYIKYEVTPKEDLTNPK